MLKYAIDFEHSKKNTFNLHIIHSETSIINSYFSYRDDKRKTREIH